MKFAFSSVLLFLLVTFTGCDQNSVKPAPSTEIAKPAEATKATEEASKPLDNSASQSPKSKSKIVVAAAADLRFAFEEISKEFQSQHPDIEIKTTYGSSGSLFAQLSNKAPFDVFLSADQSYPRKLIEDGFAAKETEFLYAIGQIGIWVRNDSPLDLDKAGIMALNDPSVKKIAIANPKVAPYGRAAEAALHHYQIYDAVKDRLVIGENISQTAQFVETGAADVGLIAHSLAMAPPMREKGRYLGLPDESHPKLEQGGIILSWATDSSACEKLRTFMTTEPGQSVLTRFGFELPGR